MNLYNTMFIFMWWALKDCLFIDAILKSIKHIVRAPRLAVLQRILVATNDTFCILVLYCTSTCSLVYECTHPQTIASLTSPANSSPSRVCSEPRLSSAPQCMWMWSSVHCMIGRPTKYIVTGIEYDRCTARGMRAETSFNRNTRMQIGRIIVL